MIRNRKPLMRRTPLKRTGMGSGGTDPAKAKSAPKRRGTGPSPEIRAVVLARDGYACVRCGAGVTEKPRSIHHRLRRSQGGLNTPDNLITLCGSGTTGCHGWVHANVADSQDAGWLVRSGHDPALIAVEYASEHGSGYTARLERDGGLIFGATDAAGAA